MMKLAQLEWMKLRGLVTMRVILLIYAVLLPIMYLLLSQLQFGPFNVPETIYEFPSCYGMLAWVSSYFNLMIGVIIIVFITNELKYKTQRQNMIDGLSKRDMILSKFIVVIGLAVCITVYVFILAFIFGLINGGEGMFDGIEQIGVYFIMTLGYFSFAFFFANLVKLPALAILLYLVSTIVEWILGLLTVQNYVQFFPLTTFSGLVPFPTEILNQTVQMEIQSDPSSGYIWEQGARVLLGLGYMLIFLLISYFVIKKRDV